MFARKSVAGLSLAVAAVAACSGESSTKVADAGAGGSGGSGVGGTGGVAGSAGTSGSAGTAGTAGAAGTGASGGGGGAAGGGTGGQDGGGTGGGDASAGTGGQGGGCPAFECAHLDVGAVDLTYGYDEDAGRDRITVRLPFVAGAPSVAGVSARGAAGSTCSPVSLDAQFSATGVEVDLSDVISACGLELCGPLTLEVLDPCGGSSSVDVSLTYSCEGPVGTADCPSGGE